jgi:hypothetical protein
MGERTTAEHRQRLDRLKMAKKGICTLCGKGGKLTFEHVPPRASGNVPEITLHSLEEWLARESLSGPLPGGQFQPEGIGKFALCKPCNERLGTQYVPSFIEFVKAGVQILLSIGPGKWQQFDNDLVTHYADVKFMAINRRRVAKQIVSMMLVTSGRGVTNANPDLQRFVLEPSVVDAPSQFRLFLALCPGPGAKVTGLSTILKMETGQVLAGADIVYPPFEYFFVINGETPDRGGEITSWMHADDSVEQVSLTLPIGFCHTAFPGDIRSRAQVERDQKSNMEATARLQAEADERSKRKTNEPTP